MTTGDQMIRWGATLAVLVVTGIAAVISYGHAFELVARYGESGVTARVLPLTVDGLIGTCSLVLLDCARRGRRAPWHAWGLLVAGVVATLGANIAHGLDHGPVGAAVAGWPALVAVGSFELLVRLIRDGRMLPQQDSGSEQAEQEHHSTAEPSPAPACDLGTAVRLASQTGMSKRALADAFGITRYQVGKILDQPTTHHTDPDTRHVDHLSEVNAPA